MQLPQIRIQTQPILLSIQTLKGKQSIEQPHADVQISQPKAEMTIDTKKGKLTIDQSQAWEDMNIYSPARFMEIFAQDGNQGWLEGIARRAQEGDQLMNIENGGDAIAQIAYQNAGPKTLEFNIGWIPSHFSVKMNYEHADVDIQTAARKPEINITPQKLIISYTPGGVNYQIEQYPDVNIDFVNIKYKGSGFETTI